jgi:hypothetical protein
MSWMIEFEYGKYMTVIKLRECADEKKWPRRLRCSVSSSHFPNMVTFRGQCTIHYVGMNAWKSRMDNTLANSKIIQRIVCHSYYAIKNLRQNMLYWLKTVETSSRLNSPHISRGCLLSYKERFSSFNSCGSPEQVYTNFVI